MLVATSPEPEESNAPLCHLPEANVASLKRFAQPDRSPNMDLAWVLT
jgi:hypothetical protein